MGSTNSADRSRSWRPSAPPGDAAGLAAAEPYFKDAARLRRWGDPVYAARCWLVGQSSGADDLVARATHRYADSMQEGLGWAAADPLQPASVCGSWGAIVERVATARTA